MAKLVLTRGICGLVHFYDGEREKTPLITPKLRGSIFEEKGTNLNLEAPKKEAPKSSM